MHCVARNTTFNGPVSYSEAFGELTELLMHPVIKLIETCLLIASLA